MNSSCSSTCNLIGPKWCVVTLHVVLIFEAKHYAMPAGVTSEGCLCFLLINIFHSYKPVVSYQRNKLMLEYVRNDMPKYLYEIPTFLREMPNTALDYWQLVCN